MDDFDRAQELDARFLEMSLDAHRRSRLPGRSLCVTEHCIDCGEAISLARRDASPGCIRCVTCQEQFEQENERG